MRVLHGPGQVAGQGAVMAKGLRSIGVEAASVSYVSHPYGFRTDIELDLHRHRRLTRQVRILRFTLYAVRQYDILQFHFARSLLPRSLDLPILKSLKKKIIVHFHGSDIRSREFVLHAAHRYRAPIKMADTPGLSTEVQLALVQRSRKYANRIFVATPDLLSIVPEAVHIPQAIDLTEWELAPTKLASESRVTVLHLPSHRGVKGTELVLESIEQLQSSGHSIDLVLREGCSHDEVKELYKDADIVIDQLLIGAYGLVSVQAMAVGRPVICTISDDVRSMYPSCLPVVSADPLNLTDVLRDLATNRRLRQELGREGRRYVETYHDARVVARLLLSQYLSLMDGGQ